jgi:hypothetical protein
MNTRTLVILFLFALILIVAPAAAQPPTETPVATPAAEATAENPTENPAAIVPPRQVSVDIYMLRLEPLDISSGSFTADFYLDLICMTANCLASDLAFEIMNGRALIVEKIDEIPNAWVSYRVLANIRENLNLQRYPFDEHALSIRIENPTHDVEELVYVTLPEANTVDTRAYVLGWQLHPQTEAHVEDHTYHKWGSVFSQYVFTMQVEKPLLVGVLKGLLPGVMIIIGSLLSLLLEDPITRISINTGTLVAAVLYHLTLTAPIPPVGYLVFADGFMLVNYLCIISATGVAVLMLLLNQKKRTLASHRLNRVALWIIPILWVIGQTVVTLEILG